MTAALLAMSLLPSCSHRQIIPEEALQLPAHSKIYTASNIWYEDKDSISSVNCQKGSILPFGTEVEIVRAYDDSIRMRDVSSGQTYTIDYDRGSWMMPIEEYMRMLFTTVDADGVAKDMKPAVFEKLRHGVVEEGMTREQVLLAYGHPVPCRTPSIKDDTWIYWIDTMVSRRVVFTGDKVVAIITLE